MNRKRHRHELPVVNIYDDIPDAIRDRIPSSETAAWYAIASRKNCQCHVICTIAGQGKRVRIYKININHLSRPSIGFLIALVEKLGMDCTVLECMPDHYSFVSFI